MIYYFLGIFYYLFLMISIIFFCNVINILSGINGVETGESLVICFSILILNFIETYRICASKHMLSTYFMVPFVSTSLGLLRYNWFVSIYIFF